MYDCCNVFTASYEQASAHNNLVLEEILTLNDNPKDRFQAIF